MDTPTPLLSIGVPVYNGARHLRSALDSLLDQDVEDFELVILDNASSDSTPEICAEYVAKDTRVRYERNESNIGAAGNFNRVFELCRGRYFMWGSDDDIWDPRFASACIARLETHPDAVLCTSGAQIIGDDGAPLPVPYEALDTDGLPAEDRIHQFLSRTIWYDVYSVIRPEALRQTGMYSSTFGGDVHLLLELLLLGDFLAVPETLFKYRYPQQLKTSKQQAAEIGADPAERFQHEEPWSYLASDLASVIESAGLPQAAVQTILADFVEILSRKESSWGRTILRERGWIVFPPDWATRKELAAALHPQAPLTGAAYAIKRVQRSVIWLGVRVKAAGRAMLRLLRRSPNR
jgi:hypothetical protein